jgi:hypothetical protein
MVGQAQVKLPGDFVSQVFQNSRNGNDNGDPLLPHNLNDSAGVYFRCKSDRAFKQEWYEDALKLAEHMAQWEQIQSANRLKRACPFFVFVDFRLKWRQVRADIPVAVHDAFGFACRSRRINDFDNIVRSDVFPDGNGGSRKP